MVINPYTPPQSPVPQYQLRWRWVFVYFVLVAIFNLMRASIVCMLVFCLWLFLSEYMNRDELHFSGGALSLAIAYGIFAPIQGAYLHTRQAVRETRAALMAEEQAREAAS